MDGDLLDCNNIQDLMEELQLENTCEQWRLTTDSSKVSLKAVLLHNGNKFPATIPLAHARHMKVTYENLQVLLQKIHYEEHQLNMCDGLKVMEMLTELQSGYTQLCCF